MEESLFRLIIPEGCIHDGRAEVKQLEPGSKNLHLEPQATNRESELEMLPIFKFSFLQEGRSS